MLAENLANLPPKPGVTDEDLDQGSERLTGSVNCPFKLATP